jgi:hypothetical protein
MIRKLTAGILTSVVLYAGTIELFAQSEFRAGQKTEDKPYIISVRIRQEHDDNTTTRETNQDGAWVTRITPGLDYTYAGDQTIFDFRYRTSFSFFNERSQDQTDQRHQFTLSMDHKFSERYSLTITDNFSYTEEDDIRESGFARRLGSDRILNRGRVDFNAIWSERFSTKSSYENTIAHYFEDPARTTQNYMRHEISQDFYYSLLATTNLIFNYTFENVDYDNTAVGFPSRDLDSHLALVGASHYLLPEWLVSGRAGAQIIDRKDPGANDAVSPYATLSTRWNFLDRSYAEAAYTFGETRTDNAVFTSTSSHTASGEIIHYFGDRFSMGLLGQIQHALFDQDATNTTLTGVTGSFEEWTLTGEINASYDFTNYLSAEVGYRHSTIDSEFVGRDYWRNQFYLGITGRY